MQIISAAIAAKFIVAISAKELIVAVAADQQVRAIATIERVIACSAVERDRSIQQQIAERRARANHIVAAIASDCQRRAIEAAGERLDAQTIVAGPQVHGHRQTWRDEVDPFKRSQIHATCGGQTAGETSDPAAIILERGCHVGKRDSSRIRDRRVIDDRRHVDGFEILELDPGTVELNDAVLGGGVCQIPVIEFPTAADDFQAVADRRRFTAAIEK